MFTSECSPIGISSGTRACDASGRGVQQAGLRRSDRDWCRSGARQLDEVKVIVAALVPAISIGAVAVGASDAGGASEARSANAQSHVPDVRFVATPPEVVDAM